MGLDEKVAMLVNALFGALMGLLIFMFACNGFRFIFTGRGGGFWSGFPGFLICAGGGTIVGALSYLFRNHEFGEYAQSKWAGSDPLNNFLRRLLYILIAVGTYYFVRELMR